MDIFDAEMKGHPDAADVLLPTAAAGLPRKGDALDLRREQDSLDDFEHLGDVPPGEADRRADGEDFLMHGTEPIGGGEAARAQAFLDTEREELLVAPARMEPIAPVLEPSPAPPAPAPAPAPAALPDDRLEPARSSPAAPSPEPLEPEPEPAPAPAPASPSLATRAHEDPDFADSREELSPAPSEESLPDAVESQAPDGPLPPSPARRAPTPETAAVAPPTVAPPAPPSARAAPPPREPAVGSFCDFPLDFLYDPDRLHPQVEALLYWRTPARSGAALGAGLALLLALACCSLISVLAYTSLLVLTATFAWRVYRCVLQAVQKTSDGHPFKEVLEADLSLSPERAQELAVTATTHLNAAVNELRRLFLVEDLVDSLKFGVMLWCLTYLGSWFNGMTLIIIGYVALFTLPKTYETNKAQIDAYLEVVNVKIQEITNKVKAAIPLGKKAESEKDK